MVTSVLAYLLPRDEPIHRRVVESELATASAAAIENAIRTAS